MYTLDTNAIIYYLKDDPNTISVLQDIFAKSVPIYISAITEIELFGFSDLNAKESEQIERVLQTLSVIPIDSNLARIAGTIRRLYGIKIADSAVAATALFTGTTLVTRNVSDFRKIPNLSILKI